MVYVVDDDSSVRASLSRLLRCAGFACQTYSSGEALLADLPQDVHGCALVDVHMPGMNGIELVHLLQRVEPRVPAVLMTAFDNEQTRQDAAAAHVALLRKPFDDQELLEALALALQRTAPSG